MTIRVLEIIPTLVRGGAEKQLTLLATGLDRTQFDVHVAVLTQDGPHHETLRRHGVPVRLIDKRWKLDPAAYHRLRRFVRELQPDVVHTWIFAANCYGRQAAFAAGVRHVVAGERCADRWKVWHELAIDRYLARRTERIAVNSAGVRDFYVQQGLPIEKFTLIPNGIEPFESRSERSRGELLAELHLPPTTSPPRSGRPALAPETIQGPDLGGGVAPSSPRRFAPADCRRRSPTCIAGTLLRADPGAGLRALSWETATTSIRCCPISIASGWAAATRGNPTRSWKPCPPAFPSWRPTYRAIAIWSSTSKPACSSRWAIAANSPARRNASWKIVNSPSRSAGKPQQRMNHEFSVEQMIQRHADLYRELVTGRPPDRP